MRRPYGEPAWSWSSTLLLGVAMGIALIFTAKLIDDLHSVQPAVLALMWFGAGCGFASRGIRKHQRQQRVRIEDEPR